MYDSHSNEPSEKILLETWTTTYGDREKDELCVRTTTGSIVADLRTHATVKEARLIAAAPDLLREMRRACAFLRENGYDMSGVNAALEKAQS